MYTFTKLRDRHIYNVGVRVRVGVGPVEFQLYILQWPRPQRTSVTATVWCPSVRPSVPSFFLTLMRCTRPAFVSFLISEDRVSYTSVFNVNISQTPFILYDTMHANCITNSITLIVSRTGSLVSLRYRLPYVTKHEFIVNKPGQKIDSVV